ncbi:MAG: hypothetical protein V2J89_01040 [Halieaceae bacterium]|jgi:hypothetical protein|nr:hypothetical protein [Halieaceae bacterium]
MATQGGKGTKRGKKRTVKERERDLAFIARHYLRGYSQNEIAVELGKATGTQVTRQQICYDLKKLQEQWREEQLEAIDELKARELAKLDHMEAEAWAAWERSKEQAEKTKKGRRTGGRNAGEYAEVQVEERIGDPRYMDLVLKCVEKRTKLLGLDAPIKVAETDEEGNFLGVVRMPGIAATEEDWAAMVAQAEARRKAQAKPTEH